MESVISQAAHFKGLMPGLRWILMEEPFYPYGL
jgi:hypothetical protein